MRYLVDEENKVLTIKSKVVIQQIAELQATLKTIYSDIADWIVTVAADESDEVPFIKPEIPPLDCTGENAP